MKSINKNHYIGIGLIAFAVIFRVFSVEMSWHNVAPLVGISLLSGFLFKRSALAFLIPLAIYFGSDLYLQLTSGAGFYGVSQYFVYGAMALVALLGTFMKKNKPLSVAGFALSGTLLFWIISNFGVFAAGFYGYSFAGLVQTYLMAIPFYTPMGTELFVNAIVGDLIFTSMIFATYSVITSKVMQLKVDRA
ncbi:MAG TPA: DUF6580 family putative transport protein [Chitinophagaceae bacterium]|nr:DUF6580 family putative transport protein [Chitinophagaceae bacterium]